MPPLPRLRIGALDDLARQLRFAPPETLRRQMQRARELAGEVDPQINYPEEWIVFRITGYRPQIDDPATVVGAALLSDMSALVERLSAAAKLHESELDAPDYLDADALCARWGISRKTLERYRRMGLVALRVIGADGRARLAFPLDAVLRFESQHGARLADACSFQRLGDGLESRMLSRASRYARAGLSLNQAAGRIAQRYGRGHETVRQLLQREGRALFPDRGPPTARERDLIERASWRWIEPAALAARLLRSRASIQRITTDARAARLRTLHLPRVHPVRRADTERIEALLSQDSVSLGLGAPGETDLLRFVLAARATPAPAVTEERTRALAYHALLARAAAAIAALPAHGAQAMEVDRIETDLRWAARLKALLVASQLGQLVRTFESSLSQPLEEVRTGILRMLVPDGLAALGQAVDSFEARKGGRLAAAAGLALTRLAAQFQRRHGAELVRAGGGRAASHLAAGIGLVDWTRSLTPWQQWKGTHWLEPHPAVRAGLHVLDEHDRQLLCARLGWGSRPSTHGELASRFDTTPMHIALRERCAARQAIAHVRQAHYSR